MIQKRLIVNGEKACVIARRMGIKELRKIRFNGTFLYKNINYLKTFI